MVWNMDSQAVKSDVAQFWDSQPCGSFVSKEVRGGRAFFEQVAQYRYATQPFMQTLIGFQKFSKRRILEVGCGLGTDLRQFASAGAQVVGVDLSMQSVSLARQHFRAFGTEGSFSQSDGEHLPFAGQSFDAIYSFGVLHHTPNTQAAFDECYRVLKSGGEFIVMLYNSVSWLVAVEPYLVAIKRLLLRQPLPSNFINPSETIRRYDGAENPLGRAYSPREVRQLLHRFTEVELSICHPLIIEGPQFARSYSRFLEWSRINRYWGFWIVAHARKLDSKRKTEEHKKNALRKRQYSC